MTIHEYPDLSRDYDDPGLTEGEPVLVLSSQSEMLMTTEGEKMSLGSWLSLTDYSTRRKVSVSTLRRKIKADDITYRLEDGKYYILDEVDHPRTHQQEHRPSPKSDPKLMGSLAGSEKSSMMKKETQETLEARTSQLNQQDVLQVVNNLMTELKKAYSQILHEKEEQIMLLREEIMDLKTLVKVLEKS